MASSTWSSALERSPAPSLPFLLIAREGEGGLKKVSAGCGGVCWTSAGGARLRSAREAPPGTAAEEAVASVVEEELERRGLSVERQEFRCASWTEESVWLSVDGAEVPAVALPPSPSGYVEGELVHVRSVLGAGDLDGKVALVGMAREDPDHAASLYALLARAGASAVVFYDFHPRVLRRIVVGIFASYREGPGLPPPIPAVAVRLDGGGRPLRPA